MSDLAGRQILVVDDEPDLLAVTMEMLMIAGAEVRGADGAHAALRILREHPIDAIVSDVRMPGGSGIDLLAALAGLLARPPTLLVTGFAELTNESAFDLGAQALLPKPTDYRGLVHVVSQMLTPRERRWGFIETSSATDMIRRSLPAVEECLGTNLLKLGSHGFCLAWPGDTPRAATPLRIDFADGCEIEAIVRWSRPGAIGAEIISINDEGRSAWLKRLADANPVAFIPRA